MSDRQRKFISFGLYIIVLQNVKSMSFNNKTGNIFNRKFFKEFILDNSISHRCPLFISELKFR